MPYSSITPDLTGENPLYKVTNFMYAVEETGQKIYFPDTVFAESIVVILHGTINSTLIKDLDWVIQEDDIDIDARSKCRLTDPEFDKVLIKSITFIKDVPTDIVYRVSVQHQRLYPDFRKGISYHGTPTEFNPELLGHILSSLEYLTAITTPAADVHSVTTTSPKLLPLDIHKENPNNLIEDEVHRINVVAGQYCIKPTAGSFFRDSLILKSKLTGDVFVEGVDYMVVGNNRAKTKLTSNESGVYDYVFFKTRVVDVDVEVTYHAYGGDPTIQDISEVHSEMTNLVEFLNNARFMTAESLGNTPMINDLMNRLGELEDVVRKLCKTGKPSYGDVSNGRAILLKVHSSDSELHWYSIANLYKVDGSDDVVLADQFRFRMQMLHSKFMFDLVASVNLDNPDNPFSCSLVADNSPIGYTPFGDISGVDMIKRLQIRAIWNHNPIESSGVTLQIGIPMRGMTEESIAIEDLSGNESAWKLIEENAVSVGPQDDVVTLPNPTHIWSLENNDSRVDSMLLPLSRGHLAWVGNEPLNRPVDGAKTITLSHLIHDDTDISKITKVRIDLMEQDVAAFPVDILFVPGMDNLRGATTINYNGAPADFVMNIEKDIDGDIHMYIHAHIQAGISSNVLTMRHVTLFTS